MEWTISSPAITEGAFARVPSEYRHMPGIHDAISVGKRAGDGWRRIGETFQKVDADPSMPPAARALAKVNFATKRVSEIQEMGAKAWSEIHRAHNGIEHEIKASFAVPIGIDAAELRAGLFRLSPDERSKVLNAAVAAGPGDPVQRAVFGAVMNSPEFLSGITPVTKEMLREKWIHTYLPEVVEKRAALKEASMRLDALCGAAKAQLEKLRRDAGPVVDRAAEARAALEAVD